MSILSPDLFSPHSRFRGKERNTTGDGFLATFDGPARAIRCALAITQTVKQLGIDVRASVHTGECELMDDNVGGIAVHIGARIMAQAEPGNVLVSGTVKDLVSGWCSVGTVGIGNCLFDSFSIKFESDEVILIRTRSCFAA